MRIRNHNVSRARKGGSGYTLVELLLVAALLMLFGTAAIINLQPSDQTSNLDQGAFRLTSLLRFARAEAANSGRRVRVSFVQDTNQVANASNQLNQIQLTWEPKPLDQPDVFECLPRPQWGVERVNETIGVQTVRLFDPSKDDADDVTNLMEGPVDDGPSPSPGPPPPITFNPDGSSDSAEIVLAARNADDARRIAVRVEGLTGSISSGQVVANDGPEDANGREAARQLVPVGSQ